MKYITRRCDCQERIGSHLAICEEYGVKDDSYGRSNGDRGTEVRERRNAPEASKHDDPTVILRIVRTFPESILRIVRNMTNFILRFISGRAIMLL